MNRLEVYGSMRSGQPFYRIQKQALPALEMVHHNGKKKVIFRDRFMGRIYIGKASIRLKSGIGTSAPKDLQ